MKRIILTSLAVALSAFSAPRAWADGLTAAPIPGGLALSPLDDSPVPHDFTCGNLVYNQIIFGSVFFSNAAGTGGTDGFLFDQVTLDPAQPLFRKLCSVQGGFFSTAGGAYTATMRVYGVCPADLANGGACFGAPELLAEVGPVNIGAGGPFGVNFDLATPVVVPDTIWIGFKVTGNTTAGPIGGTNAAGALANPTIGTSAINGDAAQCSSNGTRPNSCAFELNAAGTSDNFYFKIGAQSTVTCSVPPAGGSILENEPACAALFDETNGGCNGTPPLFTAIASGQTHAGTVRADSNTRDQDWYEYTVPSGHQNLSLTVRGEFPVSVVLLNGTCPPIVMKAATGPPCTDVNVSVCAPAGTYRMIVQPNVFNGVNCGARYNASFTANACTPVPATDFCVDATAAAVGETPFSTVGSSTDGPAQINCAGANANDIWFEHTATINGDITISTCHPSTNYDTSLTVYDGCDCQNLVELACNQNTLGCNTVPAPGGLGSSVAITATQGNCYLIRVGSPGNYVEQAVNFGSGTLVISVPCPNTNTCGGVLGDLNLDTIPDGKDIQGFVNCWITGPCVANGCECADMDFDLDLQSDDLADFINLLLQ